MLIQLLEQGARLRPDAPLVISDAASQSYGAAMTSSERIAAGLDARSIRRFGCQIRDVAELLPVLCAASAVGSDACVYPGHLDGEGVTELARLLGHDTVVVDHRVGVPGVEELTVTDLRAPQGRALRNDGPAPVTILTTGTTGTPKAVRHDWSRLVPRVPPGDASADARWLLAFNVNQFAGLQVLLRVLATTATLVAPASMQARAVIEAMDRHRVTHASATPTMWRVVVAQLDEPSARALALEQITLGGEAVTDELLDRLHELFPSARISHVYASTEFGSAVAISDGRAGLPVSVLDRSDDADVQFKIVDGELHARSRVGMVGYLGDAATDDIDWRATGDLVEVRDDRIYFVGRTSDVINVGGVKVPPLPTEERVAAVPGVALARVYGRRNPVSGQIVAADVVAVSGEDTEALEARIHAATASLPAAARPRRIRFVEAIDVNQHKVVRREGGDDGDRS